MKKIFLILLLVLPFLPVSAQETLSPELLWKIRRVSDPQVSPDGKSVLFGVSAYDLSLNKGNRDLYIVDLPSANGKGKSTITAGRPRRLTQTDGGEYNARWRPDGQKIGFLRSTENGLQLFEMNADGSDEKIVTRYEGGLSNFAYSPDGKYISFTRDIKMDATVNELYKDLPKANARIIDDLMYRHWNAWHDFAYSHVFYAPYTNGQAGEAKDIMSGQAFDSPLQPFGGGEQIAWSPNGSTIAYVCKKLKGSDYAVSTNSEIYLYDLASGKTSNMTLGNKGYDLDPVFSPDGSKIAWLSMERAGYESDKSRIFVMDLKNGKKKDITKDFAHNASGISWSADGKLIYFISTIRATKQMLSVNANNGKVRQITEGFHNMNSVAEAGDLLVGSMNTMSYPVELYTVNKATGKPRQLTAMNATTLSAVKWGMVRQRMVKTTDGKDMHTWVIYPPDFDPKKKYPTLLYCQGGPQSTVSQFFSYRWNFQLMAAKGYIIVAPNRRGLPSFGTEWNEEISGDWGGQAIQDYLSAIDDVAKESYVNKDKLGAVGASYGGYSVYYLAGMHNKRFKAFISHCGLYNLESWYGSTEEMFFANWDIGGAYWESPQPKSYQKFSPHKLAGKWDTPILVIHGGKDFRVPETQGMEAFNAAQLQGIESRFLYFPTEGHWVRSPQNGLLWHRVFFEWLDKYLK
ncbi:MAG TPA: S9 family peptidase [Bacteroidetes bacterium]|nr:S9 family peptidase [Bacteroidota bacterium]